jgi:hypothetical protein
MPSYDDVMKNFVAFFLICIFVVGQPISLAHACVADPSSPSTRPHFHLSGHDHSHDHHSHTHHSHHHSDDTEHSSDDGQTPQLPEFAPGSMHDLDAIYLDPNAISIQNSSSVKIHFLAKDWFAGTIRFVDEHNLKYLAATPPTPPPKLPIYLANASLLI